MLELRKIRDNADDLGERLSKRGLDGKSIMDKIVFLDNIKRQTQVETEIVLTKLNEISKTIGELMKSGNKTEAEIQKQNSLELKEQVKVLEEKSDAAEQELVAFLLTVPNAPYHLVPKGKTPEDNEVVYETKKVTVIPEGSVPHWDLAKKYDLIDFELGVKITGAGFPVYKGKGAKLQRALINYFLDKATAQGYLEVQPPIVVNEESGYGTGQLPDKEGQMYYMPVDNLYLVPTAEVPVTNIYRDTIQKAEDLPIKNTAYTPCFRREAGSYGKDVRGLNRLHQFDKVEIVQIQKPEDSYAALEQMKDYVAGLLDELGLQYRILRLCGGDMGFASSMTYDMEVYSAGQDKWLEVSSVSNFETFQANRLKLRYKDESGKTQLLHTLNGSALALPRIVASLLENNQTENGIKIPAVLVPYTGFEWIN